MARIVTKIGNVFAVKQDDSTVKYFQYVANDLTQLNSSVIRAFKKEYGLDSKIDLSEVVKGEVDFYAHCVLKWGIQLGYWEKVGKVADVGKVEVFFRDTNDYGRKLGEDPVLISEKWFVWKINEKHQSIGRLTGEYLKAEIGLVVNAENIVTRMRTGAYSFEYPS